MEPVFFSSNRWMEPINQNRKIQLRSNMEAKKQHQTLFISIMKSICRFTNWIMPCITTFDHGVAVTAAVTMCISASKNLLNSYAIDVFRQSLSEYISYISKILFCLSNKQNKIFEK